MNRLEEAFSETGLPVLEILGNWASSILASVSSQEKVTNTICR